MKKIMLLVIVAILSFNFANAQKEEKDYISINGVYIGDSTIKRERVLLFRVEEGGKIFNLPVFSEDNRFLKGDSCCLTYVFKQMKIKGKKAFCLDIKKIY